MWRAPEWLVAAGVESRRAGGAGTADSSGASASNQLSCRKALSCCRVSPVAVARRRRCEEGRRRARLGGCSRGERGFGHSQRERWCREAAMVRPPVLETSWGILEENHETEWMWVGCRGADAGGSGGAEGPSGRGCVRAAQAAQCGRPEHTAAAAYAALSVCAECLLVVKTYSCSHDGYTFHVDQWHPCPSAAPQRHASAARAAVSAHEQGRLRSQTSDAALRQKIFE